MQGRKALLWNDLPIFPKQAQTGPMGLGKMNYMGCKVETRPKR